MPTPSVDWKTWKYLEEEYPITVDFTKRLRAGQLVASAEVTAVDTSGDDATAAILKTATIEVASPRVGVYLAKYGGVKGQFYYVKVIAITQSDRVEQIVELEIR